MRTIFTKEEIAAFKRHPCVFYVSERSIHYTYEFKKRALELHAQGVSAPEIWKRAGFDPGRWKYNYTYSTIKDWKRIVEKRGLDVTVLCDLARASRSGYYKRFTMVLVQSFRNSLKFH